MTDATRTSAIAAALAAIIGAAVGAVGSYAAAERTGDASAQVAAIEATSEMYETLRRHMATQDANAARQDSTLAAAVEERRRDSRAAALRDSIASAEITRLRAEVSRLTASNIALQGEVSRLRALVTRYERDRAAEGAPPIVRRLPPPTGPRPVAPLYLLYAP